MNFFAMWLTRKPRYGLHPAVFVGIPFPQEIIDQRRYKNNQEKDDMKEEIRDRRQQQAGDDDQRGDEPSFGLEVHG